MIFVSIAVEILIFPRSYCAFFVPPNLLHPTKSGLYLASTLATAISNKALYKLLTFHVNTRVSLSIFLWHETSSRGTSPGESSGGEIYLRKKFCFQRKHLAHMCLLTCVFLRTGVVSTSPNPQPGGPMHPF